MNIFCLLTGHKPYVITSVDFIPEVIKVVCLGCGKTLEQKNEK